MNDLRIPALERGVTARGARCPHRISNHGEMLGTILLEAGDGHEPVPAVRRRDNKVVRGGQLVAGSGHERLVPGTSARAGVGRDDGRAARAILVAAGPAGVAEPTIRISGVGAVLAVVATEWDALPAVGRSP